MKKIGLIVLALLSVTEMSSQERFFSFVSGWGATSAVETFSGYTVIGMSFQDSFENQIQFDELSFEGAALYSYSFAVDSVNATGSRGSAKQLLQISDTEYLAVGSMSSNTSVYGLVFRHNIELQTSEVLLINDDAINTQFYGIHSFSDTTYLVTAILSGTTANTRLYCIGYNDSIYWTQDFSWGGNQYLTFPHDMTVTTEGDILGLFIEYDLEGSIFFEDRERSLLDKMNDAGEEIWRVYPGDYEEFKIRLGGVIESNGDVIVCFTDPYYYDSTGEWQGNASNKVRFERYDSDGTLLDVDSVIELEYYGPLRIVNQFTELSDGDYLVAGYHNNGMAMMMKLQPDLDLQWNRRYTPYPYSENPLQESALFNVIETSDGGFLGAGEYITYPGGANHPNGYQSGFALKVDSLGCLEEGCHVVGLTDSKFPEVKIYPNPSPGELYIDGLLSGEEHTITVYNLNGQVIQRFEQRAIGEVLRIEGLKRGYYQIRIKGESFGVVVKQIVVI